MQTGFWIALAGGGGALVGGIGAQIVSGIFTKRRADDARKVDRWGHWRNERLDAYADYIAQVARWAERSFVVLDLGQSQPEKRETLPLPERIELHDAAIKEYQLIAAPYSKVQVLGSGKVNHKVEILNEYVYSFHLATRLTASLTDGEADFERYRVTPTPEEFQREFRDLLDAIVQSCREDLGI